MELVESGRQDGGDRLMVAWAGFIHVKQRVTMLTWECRTESVFSAISCRFRAKYTTGSGRINRR